MKRLKRIADTENVNKLLDRIDKASTDLKDTYYALFDNLNALYESYPNLYKQLEMVVKLPNNEDAKDIVQMDSDLTRMLENLKDEQYLESYIGPGESEGM